MCVRGVKCLVGSNDLLCGPHSLLQSVPVLFGGRSKLDSYGNAEDRLDDGSVKDDQQLPRQVKLSQLTQKVQTLLGLHPDIVYVGDCSSQELE